MSYLEPAYRELGVILNDQVRRRFEDVKAFHHSVVRNRRRFLEEEIQELTDRLASRRQERADLGEDQARLLRELADGGALEALTALQTALGREEAALGALRHRFDAAQALEASARQITAKSVELQQAVDLDLRERRQQTGEAILLFSQYAQRLYGEGREAYLAIEAGRSSLSITPRIDADDSRGINNMVIFCFDLTLAVLAHRHGRGPDFLIHDSHLYDGVDERQVARALALAAEVTDEEHMQYIVTLNTDTLSTAAQRGFNPEPHIRSPASPTTKRAASSASASKPQVRHSAASSSARARPEPSTLRRWPRRRHAWGAPEVDWAQLRSIGKGRCSPCPTSGQPV
ncbi:ABC-three component system protein [Streptomyces sp. M10(2022)]